MMSDLLTNIVVPALLIVGAGLLLLASVGITRMPDLFTRMQTATKASTLGIGFMLMAAAAHFQTLPITLRAVAGVTFFFLTAPVAAHLIARAAHFVHVPLWDGTVLDELRGRYDDERHLLRSHDPVIDEQAELER